MIKALASLGATHHISLVLAYTGDQCTATVIVKPKDDEKAAKSFQFEGTVDEVEAAVTAQTESVALKIVRSHTTIAELEAQLKADEDAAKAKGKKGAKTAPPAKAEADKPTPAKAEKGRRGKKPAAAASPTKPTSAQPATALLDDL